MTLQIILKFLVSKIFHFQNLGEYLKEKDLLVFIAPKQETQKELDSTLAVT